MKRRIWIGAACAALACVMGYWVFRSWSSDDYLHALPSRPKALMAVDWLRLADDSGLGRDGLAAWFPERGTLPQGIDWKKRSYLFVSGKEYVGLLVPVEDNIYSLELFHGPTLAFKDVGGRFMSRLLAYFIGKQQKQQVKQRKPSHNLNILQAVVQAHI